MVIFYLWQALTCYLCMGIGASVIFDRLNKGYSGKSLSWKTAAKVIVLWPLAYPKVM